MTKLRQLREKLEQGFYIDNLYEMARLCRDMALESNNPAPFFIMYKIFYGIADYWEKGPVVVEEAKLVESELLELLKELVTKLENITPVEQMANLINKAVSSYLFLFKQ